MFEVAVECSLDGSLDYRYRFPLNTIATHLRRRKTKVESMFTARQLHAPSHAHAGIGEWRYIPPRVFIWNKTFFLRRLCLMANFNFDFFAQALGLIVHSKYSPVELEWRLPSSNICLIDSRGDVFLQHRCTSSDMVQASEGLRRWLGAGRRKKLVSRCSCSCKVQPKTEFLCDVSKCVARRNQRLTFSSFLPFWLRSRTRSTA